MQVEAVVHGHLWPRGLSQNSGTSDTCANVQLLAVRHKKQLLRFYALLALKTWDSQLFALFFWADLSPLCLSPPVGKGTGIPVGLPVCLPAAPSPESSRLGHQAALLGPVWVFTSILWKMTSAR